MTTIIQFCEHHDACSAGMQWALSTGCETMEELWKRDDVDPKWRMWIATRPGVMSDRDLRLFAVWCAYQVRHLMTEPARNAVDVALLHAHGLADDDQLSAARDAALRDARYTAWDAALGAAMSSARDVALDAVWDAAWDAARCAARCAARGVARFAAWYAAWNAAWNAARDAQVRQLMTYPVNFTETTHLTPQHTPLQPNPHKEASNA